MLFVSSSNPQVALRLPDVCYDLGEGAAKDVCDSGAGNAREKGREREKRDECVFVFCSFVTENPRLIIPSAASAGVT